MMTVTMGWIIKGTMTTIIMVAIMNKLRPTLGFDDNINYSVVDILTYFLFVMTTIWRLWQNIHMNTRDSMVLFQVGLSRSQSCSFQMPAQVIVGGYYDNGSYVKSQCYICKILSWNSSYIGLLNQKAVNARRTMTTTLLYNQNAFFASDSCVRNSSRSETILQFPIVTILGNISFSTWFG